jgi:class 3 adenylate cyclase
MFCDLADSTKLSGQLDPEDLRDVIRAYQATSAEVIERYDGYIAQHLGDGLMVYFGWPQAHEDDARRAVHAGLGIVEAMGQLNARLAQEKGILLALRIGIHTGLVVVGEIGKGASQEHLALGETPNIASRIEGIANTTYQLVQGYFVCNDLGHHRLRGVDDTQQVYRVVRESDAQSRLDIAASRGFTPLVGRESEMALLLERWEQVKDGQGQTLLLGGEAGIGKSRLVEMLRERVAQHEGDSHLTFRCSPYHANSALYPVIDYLERLLQFRRNDTPTDKLARLKQMLQASGFSQDNALQLFAALLSMPLPEHDKPLPMTPQEQHQQTLETLTAWLLAEAELF